MLQIMSINDPNEFTEALKKLLQTMSSRVFYSYDSYFRSDMYSDDTQLYEYLHNHFIPDKVSHYRSLTYLKSVPGYSFILLIFICVLAAAAFLIGIPVSFALRILLALPYLIMLPILLIWIRKRTGELDMEIELLRSIDERFKNVLQVASVG